MSKPTNVPIGPTTIAGYGGTVVGLIAAVLALIFPDSDEQTISLIAAATFAIGSFLVTQVGRYLQAKEMAKAAAWPTEPEPPSPAPIWEDPLGEDDADDEHEALAPPDDPSLHADPLDKAGANDKPKGE